jgi:hypothetical protein
VKKIYSKQIFLVIVVMNTLLVNNFGQNQANSSPALNETKTNYLREIEKSLPPGVEKDFFLALEKPESQHLELIEALNLFQNKKLQSFGTVQLPGQKPEPMSIDLGESWVTEYRLKLRWEKTLKTSNDSFRLLFFQQTGGYSLRPTGDCLIATTDISYQIRRWFKSGCYEYFKKASISATGDGFIFKIAAKAYDWEKGLRINRYQITSDKIAWIRPD